jgi:NDP-sugar pyrophosphorylase family protein
VKWVFPMAGRGTRTSELGSFKPFVQVGGRRMLAWLLKSIASKIGEHDSLVFITTESYAMSQDVPVIIEAMLRDTGIGNSFELVTTHGTPPGPSATVHSAKALLQTEEPVIVVNCDQYIDFDLVDMSQNRCGFLPVYAQFGSKSSFVRIERGIITLIVEKENISNIASAGVYAVSSCSALIRAIERQFEQDQSTNGEFYVGVALNNLIGEGYRFYPCGVRAKYDLGNVQDIRRFEAIVASIYEAV